jgi:hypothetical protein
MAGSVPYAKMAVEKIVHSIAAIPERDKTKVNIRNKIESVLFKLHEKHIFKHPHFQLQGGPDFYLIVGVWSHLDGLDFFSQTETALTDIVDFHCTGVGEDLSRFVIKSIFRHRGLSIWDAANVAVHVLRLTKENVTYCGGRDQFAYLTSEGIMGSSFGSRISGTQYLSEVFSESIRRLYLWVADLDSPDSRLDQELLLLKSAIESARAKVDDEKRFYSSYTLVSRPINKWQ